MQLQGNFLDYIVVFWAGVLISFTPCVYPVIPLTASFIAGINTRGTKRMGFVLSLIYVFGLAVTYCVLAAVAALTGKLFGQIQNNPAVSFALANVFLIFGLAMIDAIQLPGTGINVQDKIKAKNIWTVVLFGMASGLAVSACTAPMLGALLFYVASKQNILHGISLMFVFSYGVGASLILVGTFSGILGSLPKSGPWMVRVKRFCGWILIFAAEFFLIKAGMLLF